jgi:hypothetical protein
MAGVATELSPDMLPPLLAAKIEVDPESGCWMWLAGLRGGYGQVRWGGRNWAAHRLVYELLVGPIADGLDIDHLCRTPPCVNPEHTEQVTRRENIRRGTCPAAVNARKTHCAKGHLLAAWPEAGTGRRWCPCAGWAYSGIC